MAAGNHYLPSSGSLDFFGLTTPRAGFNRASLKSCPLRRRPSPAAIIPSEKSLIMLDREGIGAGAGATASLELLYVLLELLSDEVDGDLI